jgi:acyl carrier protein
MNSIYDRRKIEGKVLEIVAARVDRDVSDIPIDKTFEELGFESIDALDIMFALEDEFEVTIPDDVAESINCVKSLVDIIADSLENKPAV